ncbi:MAG: beta-N-acetylhexosaminidase [Bacteroidales bacterium]|nr:beta-N-acetylhexosaminidase [Bacteroidales bacterium]
MSKKLFLTLLLAIFSFQLFDLQAQSVQIVPQPNSVVVLKGKFTLLKTTAITYSGGESAKPIAQQLADLLNRSTGYVYTVKKEAVGNSIHFQLIQSRSFSPEGYTLKVGVKGVKITAATPQGLFYGLQSLRQLFPAEIESENSNPVAWSIPYLNIEDSPRYTYRGMHLDVSRHFFDKKVVMKYIDMMSLYKYNTFHWHLTDDQGWRIQIKKYPKLTKISAFRTECNGDTVGGYYTQDEVKEVVAYAKQRFVEVIPEIEMPGHAVSVLAAYPEFSCSGGPFTVPATWGIFHDVFCAGNDSVYQFMQNVMDEVTPLFPSKYVHIGGDECKKTRWERCMKCQKRMKDENLANEHQLQSYFINRMEKYLNKSGKQIIGWDEILEGGISNSATIMSWRGVKGGIEAATHGNDVVMTPGSHCYFDHYQGDQNTEPLAFGKGKKYDIPLAQVYTFNPTPKELTTEQAKHILGGQANLWTEYISTASHLEYMAYPRALAMSECLWTMPVHKDYDFFTTKVHAHYDRMTRYGINFSKSADK